MRASFCSGAFFTALTLWLPFHWHAHDHWYGLCLCLAGWPLPWLEPSQVTSLSYNINVVFLALDLAFWVALSSLFAPLRSERSSIQLTLLALTLSALAAGRCGNIRATLPDPRILQYAQPTLGNFSVFECAYRTR